MKTLEEIIKILLEHEKKLRKKYKIRSIKIFGSYVEKKQKKTSDIDLIIDFEETPTFVELIRIEESLEKILGIKVDLLTEESISPFIKPYIKEIVVI